MERLTKSYPSKDRDTLYLPYPRDNISTQGQMLNVRQKLGQLEDLEEQIGMPILELFNEILGKDIYYIDDDTVSTCRALGIRLVTTNDSIFSFTSVIPDNYDYAIITDSCWTFNLSDYRKLWFLDEKEAE